MKRLRPWALLLILTVGLVLSTRRPPAVGQFPKKPSGRPASSSEASPRWERRVPMRTRTGTGRGVAWSYRSFGATPLGRGLAAIVCSFELTASASAHEQTPSLSTLGTSIHSGQA